MFRFFLLVSGWASGGLAAAGYTLPAVYSATGEVRSQVARLDKLGADQSYSLLFSVNSPEALTADARVAVSVVEDTRVLLQKTLHAGDADLYVSFRTASARRRQLRISAQGATGRYLLQINRWPDSTVLKTGPNHSWR